MSYFVDVAIKDSHGLKKNSNLSRVLEGMEVQRQGANTCGCVARAAFLGHTRQCQRADRQDSRDPPFSYEGLSHMPEEGAAMA